MLGIFRVGSSRKRVKQVNVCRLCVCACVCGTCHVWFIADGHGRVVMSFCKHNK